MTDSTQGQGHAATDLSPPVRLHVVVGYDATPPASRALDAAVRLLRGREGSIEVSYVAHVPGLDMLSADAIVEARAGFDEIEQEVRGSAAARLDGRGIAWEFRRRDGLIADELIAAVTASRDARPGDTQLITQAGASHGRAPDRARKPGRGTVMTAQAHRINIEASQQAVFERWRRPWDGAAGSPPT